YAWEKLTAMAFERHRIRRWRIGTEEQIRGYPRDEVIQYYEHYYKPENMTLVVVGDFNPEVIFSEIEKKYSKMPGGKVSRDLSEKEGVQTSPRMQRILGDIAQPIVKMGFHAPTLLEPDYYPVTFLSILLGRGKSSRLFKTLKEEKELVDGIG